MPFGCFGLGKAKEDGGRNFQQQIQPSDGLRACGECARLRAELAEATDAAAEQVAAAQAAQQRVASQRGHQAAAREETAAACAGLASSLLLAEDCATASAASTASLTAAAEEALHAAVSLRAKLEGAKRDSRVAAAEAAGLLQAERAEAAGLRKELERTIVERLEEAEKAKVTAEAQAAAAQGTQVVKARVDALAAELAAAREEVGAARSEADGLRRELKSAQAEAKGVRTECEGLRSSVSEQSAALERQGGQLEAFHDEVRRTKRALEEADSSIQQLQAENGALLQSAAEKETAVMAAAVELATKEGELSKRQAELLSRSEQEARAAESRARATTAQLQAAQSKLQEAHEQLEAVGAAQKEAAKVEAAVAAMGARARMELDRARGRVSELESGMLQRAEQLAALQQAATAAEAAEAGLRMELVDAQFKLDVAQLEARAAKKRIGEQLAAEELAKKLYGYQIHNSEKLQEVACLLDDAQWMWATAENVRSLLTSAAGTVQSGARQHIRSASLRFQKQLDARLGPVRASIEAAVPGAYEELEGLIDCMHYETLQQLANNGYTSNNITVWPGRNFLGEAVKELSFDGGGVLEQAISGMQEAIARDMARVFAGCVVTGNVTHTETLCNELREAALSFGGVRTAGEMAEDIRAHLGQAWFDAKSVAVNAVPERQITCVHGKFCKKPMVEELKKLLVGGGMYIRLARIVEGGVLTGFWRNEVFPALEAYLNVQFVAAAISAMCAHMQASCRAKTEKALSLLSDIKTQVLELGQPSVHANDAVATAPSPALNAGGAAVSPPRRALLEPVTPRTQKRPEKP